jgi:GNAT superfamily N-acetyltransferase
MQYTVRTAVLDDAEACGRVVFDAFKWIGGRHNFPPDYLSERDATRFVETFIGHPGIFGVVAVNGSQVLGCNFLEERDPIRSVGPLAVTPSAQGLGVGRRLMNAVLERAQGAAGVRLVQDAFNAASMSLYASLGFAVKEPLALMTGRARSGALPEVEVRPLRSEDLDACTALCTRVHGLGRGLELREALEEFSPFMAARGGRVVAYASAPDLWLMNHGVAETEEDLQALLRGIGSRLDRPLSLLVPTRRSHFFHWCLREGLRMVKPLTLMAMGEYREPRGAYFPSISY